jgi:predicted RNA-binding Zn-ribbon protein involved in translation (DUF1610 family)
MQNLQDFIHSLSQAYNVPSSLIIAMPVFLFFLFIFLIFLVIKLLEPKYRLYKQDTFYNLVWKWKWKGSDIIDLWCYCPTCKAMLYVDDENCKATNNLGEKITFFVCNECGESEKGRIRGGDRRYALQVIKRAIMQKVRQKSFDIYAE